MGERVVVQIDSDIIYIYLFKFNFTKEVLRETSYIYTHFFIRNFL